MSYKNKLTFSFITAACLLSNATTYAARIGNTSRNSYVSRKMQSDFLPLAGRTYVDATLANVGFLYGDGIIPMVGSTEGFVFLDGTAKGGTDHGGLVALGSGLREIWRGAIFGGYVFGEFDRTGLGNYYWTVNPGIEAMSSHWDLHVNGYFPLGSTQSVNAIYFGSQLGVTCPTFKGHQQFDQVYNDVNEVAPGMDAEVGYIIPHSRRVRVFGAGYYYFFKHTADIQGVALGAEVPLNQRLSLLFRDSYDSVNKNAALLSIRIYFNALNKSDENDVHERLLDPIERHIGVLYTGAGIPTQHVLYDTGQLKLQVGNIWFFSPTGTSGVADTNSCTFENPCSSNQFTASNVNAINDIAPYTNFYLAGGNNINYPKGPFTINNGQSVYGRTADFCQIAPSGTYPIINSNILLAGYNTLQAIMLVNDPVLLPGISVINASNVTIDRVQVGPTPALIPFATIPIGTFQTGIYMNNAQNVVITNSVINAGDSEKENTPNAMGLVAVNSHFILDHSVINVRDSATITTSNVTLSPGLSAIYLLNNPYASLQNNQITMVTDGLAQAQTLNEFASVVNLQNNKPQNSILSSNANIFNLNATANSNNQASVFGYGIYTAGNANVNCKNNLFTLTTSANSGGNLAESAIKAIDTSSTAAADITLNGDKFVLNALATAYSSGGFADIVIDLMAAGGTSTITSTSTVFNLNSIANSGSNASVISTYGLITEGSAASINSNGDTFNLITTANSHNTALTSLIGVLSKTTTTGAITVNGDIFNLNSNATTTNGAALARSSVYSMYAMNAGIIHANNTIFNMNAIAVNTGSANAIARAVGAQTTGAGAITLNNNIITLRACQNGMTGTRTNTSGANITGSSTFIDIGC